MKSYLVANKLTGSIIAKDLSLEQAANYSKVAVSKAASQVKTKSFFDGWLYIREQDQFNDHEYIQVRYPVLIYDTRACLYYASSSISALSRSLSVSKDSIRACLSKNHLLLNRFRLEGLHRVGEIQRRLSIEK